MVLQLLMQSLQQFSSSVAALMPMYFHEAL